MSVSAFDRYQALKQAFQLTYRGYPVNQLMATEFAMYSFGRTACNATYQSCKINLFTVEAFSTLGNLLQKPVLLGSFNGYGSDYRELMELAMNQVPQSQWYEFREQRRKLFRPLTILRSFFEVCWKLRNQDLPLQVKAYFFIRLVYYKNCLKQLDTLAARGIATKKYLSFLSCLTPEALLCLFFKKYQIPVYTLQHGLHRSVNSYRGTVPFDALVLENLQADYFLGWGAYSKEALTEQGWKEQQFLLAGNPRSWSVESFQLRTQKYQRVVINLARDLYHTGNLQLIQLGRELQESGYEVLMKAHPRSTDTTAVQAMTDAGLEQIAAGSTVSEILKYQNIDFVIVYHSTVYYDYYQQGVVAFRFEDGIQEIPFGLADQFQTPEELRLLIQRFKELDAVQLRAQIIQMISHFSKPGTAEYARLLSV